MELASPNSKALRSVLRYFANGHFYVRSHCVRVRSHPSHMPISRGISVSSDERGDTGFQAKMWRGDSGKCNQCCAHHDFLFKNYLQAKLRVRNCGNTQLLHCP